MPLTQPDIPPPPTPAPAEDRREKMTISEAAAFCHVDYDTFLSWVRKGALPHIVVGPSNAKRVYRRDVEKLIRNGEVA